MCAVLGTVRVYLGNLKPSIAAGWASHSFQVSWKIIAYHPVNTKLIKTRTFRIQKIEINKPLSASLFEKAGAGDDYQ